MHVLSCRFFVQYVATSATFSASLGNLVFPLANSARGVSVTLLFDHRKPLRNLLGKLRIIIEPLL